MIPLMNQSSKINLKNLLYSCFNFTQVSVQSHNLGWLNTVYTTDDYSIQGNAVDRLLMIQWVPIMNWHPLDLPRLLTACSQGQILIKFHRNVHEYVTNSHWFVRKNHYQNMTELEACKVHNQLQVSGIWAVLFLVTWKHHWQAVLNFKNEFWWR